SEKLEPFELGRALYSLAQRRGFLSNRKSQRDDDDEGKVKSSISELGQELGERTLAQFFVDDVSPDHQISDLRRMRSRYTSRQMYHDEFERIQNCQQPFFPEITEENWRQIKAAIFFQRPLKSQRHRIGKCEIDGGLRCVEALDAFQQFRIWQTVQNLRIEDAFSLGRPEALSLNEQTRLVDSLQSVKMLTWKAVRAALALPNRTRFTIQEWSTKGIVGHMTNAAMIPIFGDEWLNRPTEDRDIITREVMHFRRPAALIKRGIKAWKLSDKQAQLLPAVRLDETHARHSEASLKTFVHRMQKGEEYSTIRQHLTGRYESEPVDTLPPLTDMDLDITNPAVIRAVTELRKVVNELIREYGKPEKVHIEMARSLKHSRDHRKRIHRNNEDRRKRREKAIAGILETIPGLQYSRSDIEKWLLAEECEWNCPYTGKRITAKTLLGTTPQFDVEHIYPRRYLDNSYLNKTLCDNTFNREVKQDRTAYDACSGRDDWDEILARVRRFQGPVAAIKLKRFQTGADQIEDDFTHRHLNDTRYNAVVARKYLEALYGGVSDVDGHQRVFAVTGGHTAELRWQW
ncbi:MAG: hypothetical protein MK102_19830, partial [Fuerstiella sp.]|nr:hypothetical protein [Fuerstiella sp.]